MPLGTSADNIQIYVWTRKTGVISKVNKKLEGRRIKRNYKTFCRTRFTKWLLLEYPGNQQDIYAEKFIG